MMTKGEEKGLLLNGQEVNVSKVLVDVCGAIGYDIGILEGLTIMDYPNLSKSARRSFRVRRNNIMLASLDMVAIDSVGARILGFDPERILHIKWASDQGLGVLDLDRIEIFGEEIKNVEVRSNPLYLQKEVMLKQ
jgi:uncharacterized protein (DUF362 family)